MKLIIGKYNNFLQKKTTQQQRQIPLKIQETAP